MRFNSFGYEEDFNLSLQFLILIEPQTKRYMTSYQPETIQNYIVTLLGKRSFISRSSPGGSIIFPCPDHFVGLSVLCSYWSFIVHILGDTAEIG